MEFIVRMLDRISQRFEQPLDLEAAREVLMQSFHVQG